MHSHSRIAAASLQQVLRENMDGYEMCRVVNLTMSVQTHQDYVQTHPSIFCNGRVWTEPHNHGMNKQAQNQGKQSYLHPASQPGLIMFRLYDYDYV